jgi:hypothetical protein
MRPELLWREGVHCLHLPQDRDRWLNLASKVDILHVSRRQWSSWRAGHRSLKKEFDQWIASSTCLRSELKNLVQALKYLEYRGFETLYGHKNINSSMRPGIARMSSTIRLSWLPSKFFPVCHCPIRRYLFHLLTVSSSKPQIVWSRRQRRTHRVESIQTRIVCHRLFGLIMMAAGGSR